MGDRASNPEEAWSQYHLLLQQALSEDRQKVVTGLKQLLAMTDSIPLQSHIHNDLGVLAALEGIIDDAARSFETAVRLSPEWAVPKSNLARIVGQQESEGAVPVDHPDHRTRIAIVSLLFNWPSTGGGTVHTAELARFLTRAGYNVLHVVIVYPEWSIGKIADEVDWPIRRLEFNPSNWTVESVQEAVRLAVQDFDPTAVVITDSWNTKPILAEAVKGFRYYIRIAAQECLCPLNNVRLLFANGQAFSCMKHQLATPADCCRCVAQNGKYSGALHQGEREFVDYGSSIYDASLRQAFSNAESILVVNPLIAAMIGPYSKSVRVIPSGFDAERFPARPPSSLSDVGRPTRILFAGLISEFMKGFHVVVEACELLWSLRQDFELIVTSGPANESKPFVRYIGWQTQSELAKVMMQSDMLVFPTVAEEALGRTAVEAMGAGIPVVASRIGGLQFTVLEGATGLLFEPGNPVDLMQKLKRLLDNPGLCRRLGEAGRAHFEEHYTWDAIIGRHYLPLFGPPVQQVSK